MLSTALDDCVIEKHQWLEQELYNVSFRTYRWGSDKIGIQKLRIIRGTITKRGNLKYFMTSPPDFDLFI